MLELDSPTPYIILKIGPNCSMWMILLLDIHYKACMHPSNLLLCSRAYLFF